ncbi:LOW QUALITY PROTEIN: sigma-70 factor, partial [Streptomyces griseoflavus Tu4000]
LRRRRHRGPGRLRGAARPLRRRRLPLHQRRGAHPGGPGAAGGVHRGGRRIRGRARRACTEYDWPYYGELLGARFDRHPALQPGRVLTEDRDHPATRHLPAVWEFTDEWYDFRTNPRGSVRVLLSADESSYEGGGMGADHPLAWCRDQGAGRVFYTALGHSAEAYADPGFRAHLRGGITWAAAR